MLKLPVFVSMFLFCTSLLAVDLKVSNYNIGFLDFLELGVIQVPEYEQRLSHVKTELRDFFLREKPDVLSLQEAWNKDAVVFSTDKLKTDEAYGFMEVGGGSTEGNLDVDGERKKWKSFKVGTIRIKEGILNEEVWQEMSNWIGEQSKEYNPKYAVGTGGNINKLYKLCGHSDWEN